MHERHCTKQQFSLHSRSSFVTIKIRLHSYMSLLKLDASYIYIIPTHVDKFNVSVPVCVRWVVNHYNHSQETRYIEENVSLYLLYDEIDDLNDGTGVSTFLFTRNLGLEEVSLTPV